MNQQETNEVVRSDAFTVAMPDILSTISQILKESMKAARPISSASMKDRLVRLTFKKVKTTASYYLATQLELGGIDELETEINKFIYSMHFDGQIKPALRQGMIEALDKLVLELSEEEPELNNS